MKYNNHPQMPIRRLSGETLVRIADRLAGMLDLNAVNPFVIKTMVITGIGTTEIIGEGNNPQIAWIRADSICYLRFRDFRLCYAYATREAIERDCRFAANFRDTCHISLPDVITDAAREVMREIGTADYWVAPAFRNMLTKEEHRYESGSYVESPAASCI
ncbi:MAG: hypothetical protein IJ089_00625 [Clostridia bacterium]|nr:hypothetical protein [Clostridia bacterium]MBR2288170.1 hypothetical protein [Clostridia bacterium]